MCLERLYLMEIGTLEQTRSLCFFQFALMNIEVESNSSNFLDLTLKEARFTCKKVIPIKDILIDDNQIKQDVLKY